MEPRADNMQQLIRDWLKTHKSCAMPKFLDSNPVIKQFVLDETACYTVKNIVERVYIVLTGSQPTCEYGNPRKFNTFDTGYRKGCILGNKCACVSKIRMKSQKTTLLSKYGVEAVSQIAGIVQKRKATSLMKYNVDHFSKTKEAKENVAAQHKTRTSDELHAIAAKKKKSSIEKYGVDHHMKCKQQKEKVASTNIMRYGVVAPMQNQEIKLKAKRTNQAHYGVSNPMQRHLSQHTLEILNSTHTMTDLHHTQKLSIAEISSYLAVDNTTVTNYLHKNEIEVRYYHTGSVPQQRITEYIVSQYDTKVVTNVRTIIPPKEIDIWLPEYRIAIEFNGKYWHRPEVYGGYEQWLEYHQSKIDACASKDIQLLHLWEGVGDHSKIINDALIYGRLHNDLPTVYQLYDNTGRTINDMA